MEQTVNKNQLSHRLCICAIGIYTGLCIYKAFFGSLYGFNIHQISLIRGSAKKTQRATIGLIRCSIGYPSWLTSGRARFFAALARPVVPQTSAEPQENMRFGRHFSAAFRTHLGGAL
jgi:hypothetical protein